MYMITIKNLSFNYRQKEIFNNLDLTVPDGKITSIIGPNGSGKSTLVKILVGLYKYNGEIKINEIPLLKDNRKEIRKIIGVVFTNPENQFVAETVMDDIAFTLENMNFKKRRRRPDSHRLRFFFRMFLLYWLSFFSIPIFSAAFSSPHLFKILLSSANIRFHLCL